MTGAMGELTALLQGLWRCDEGALSALYRRYGPLVFSMAWRILGSHAMAEEATQDVFWKIWQRPEAYNPHKGAFSAWLLTVARNAAIDRLRREARQPPTSEPPRRVDASPEDLLPRTRGADRIETEDGRHLRLLLDSLPRE